MNYRPRTTNHESRVLHSVPALGLTLSCLALLSGCARQPTAQLAGVNPASPVAQSTVSGADMPATTSKASGSDTKRSDTKKSDTKGSDTKESNTKESNKDIVAILNAEEKAGKAVAQAPAKPEAPIQPKEEEAREAKEMPAPYVPVASPAPSSNAIRGEHASVSLDTNKSIPPASAAKSEPSASQGSSGGQIQQADKTIAKIKAQVSTSVVPTLTPPPETLTGVGSPATGGTGTGGLGGGGAGGTIGTLRGRAVGGRGYDASQRRLDSSSAMSDSESAKQSTRFYRYAQSPVASPKPQAVYNPSMYVANNYIGGNGERDRMAKLIEAGVLVDGQRVKLEAFSHNYAQTFPIPEHTALNVTADTVQTKILQSGGHTYLQIGLQAMKGELPRRPSLNLALVIDRSGSMADEHKLEFAKSAAIKLVDSLTPQDTFSLVAFDSDVSVLVPAQHVSDKAHIRKLIAALQPGGSTNIYGGLSAAYTQLHKQEARLHADSITRVVLLSDGETNVGVTDPAQFQQMVTNEVDRDIETSSIGVGVEFNEDLMLSLAQGGKGNYHFLKDGADTQRVFTRELDELTHVVAKDVKIRIQLAPGVGLIRVLGAPTLNGTQVAQVKQEEKKLDRKVAEELGIAPNRQNVPEEPGIKMLIPAFYRGDSHVIMMEIKVPSQSGLFHQPGGSAKIADVTVKYKDLTNLTNREAHTNVAMQYTPVRDEMLYSVNRSVKKNLLGFQTGEALTQAATLIDQGRIGEAIQQVDARMTVLGVAAQQWNDKDLDKDGRLLSHYKAVLSQLDTHRQLASSDFGAYLKRSLAYNGYQMTR